MDVDGKRVDNDSELLDVWKQHYEYLYTPKNESEFHGDFKAFVERRLRQFCRDSYANDDPLDNPFELDEVVDVCNKLPNGKAGGPDQLTYEHIKYGGHTLHEVLTKFLTQLENWNM